MAIQLNQIPSFSFKSHNNFLYPWLPGTNIRFSCLQVKATSGKAQQLIESGVVKPILPKDAASAIESEGFILLDIRPVWERKKAYVTGSHHVPLFIEDPDNGLLTLLKKWVHFGYIGLWTGQNFTMVNSEFLQQVETKFPSKECKILVACGEGLRSLVAVSKLHGGGYRKLGWLVGGFNKAGDGDFENVEGTEKLQYATIGGASYYFLKMILLIQGIGNGNQMS